jgi:hypothetical protein
LSPKDKDVIDEDDVEDLRTRTLDFQNDEDRKKVLESLRTTATRDSFDVQHSTRIILPDKIRIAVPIRDYNKLQLARRFEELATWNLLSQIMLSFFFALTGIALEKGNGGFDVVFLVSFVSVGVFAAVTTLAYWIPIINASRSWKTKRRIMSVYDQEANSNNHDSSLEES